MSFISTKRKPKVGSIVTLNCVKTVTDGYWEANSKLYLIKYCDDPRGSFWEATDNLNNKVYLSEHEFTVMQ